MAWPDGLKFYPDYLDAAAAAALLEDIREITAAAPLYRPRMPRTGKPLSVAMTNCGPLGWYTDKAQGYRYLRQNPHTNEDWPPIPPSISRIWDELANYQAAPQACLINYYDADAKMGMHRDADESALDAPVVSISLGDDALFRVGGKTRKGPTQSVRLTSGAVVVLGGDARQVFHGIDRIYPGTSKLLAEGGRFNLTLRRVTLPA